MEDTEICILIHELEEASVFNSCWRTSNYEYVSNLLMKAAETILALAQSRLSDAQIINKKENDHD